MAANNRLVVRTVRHGSEFVEDIQKDLDSVVCASQNLSAFDIRICAILNVRVGRVYPCTQSKLVDFLDSRKSWWECKFLYFGQTKLLVTMALPLQKNVTLKSIVENFLRHVIRKAAMAMPFRCRSRLSNLANFTVGDFRRKPKIFGEDWEDFAREVDRILPRWKIVNGVTDLYFVRFLHGMQFRHSQGDGDLTSLLRLFDIKEYYRGELILQVFIYLRLFIII